MLLFFDFQRAAGRNEDLFRFLRKPSGILQTVHHIRNSLRKRFFPECIQLKKHSLASLPFNNQTAIISII